MFHDAWNSVMQSTLRNPLPLKKIRCLVSGIRNALLRVFLPFSIFLFQDEKTQNLVMDKTVDCQTIAMSVSS